MNLLGLWLIFYHALSYRRNFGRDPFVSWIYGLLVKWLFWRRFDLQDMFVLRITTIRPRVAIESQHGWHKTKHLAICRNVSFLVSSHMKVSVLRGCVQRCHKRNPTIFSPNFPANFDRKRSVIPGFGNVVKMADGSVEIDCRLRRSKKFRLTIRTISTAFEAARCSLHVFTSHFVDETRRNILASSQFRPPGRVSSFRLTNISSPDSSQCLQYASHIFFKLFSQSMLRGSRWFFVLISRKYLLKANSVSYNVLWLFICFVVRQGEMLHETSIKWNLSWS